MPKKERLDPAQVPALSGGREISVPSDSAVVLVQPKGQSRGQNEEPRWNMRPGLVEP